MRLFAGSLPRTKVDSGDSEARNLSQQAVWLACCGLGTISHGASHGIGYILGSLCSVPHGYTSCVMLPAVLRWNAVQFEERQKAIIGALGFKEGSAADSVRSLVAGLGLPTNLQAVGVKYTNLDDIARRSIKHPVVRNNPRKLQSAEQVREILELAWS